MGLGSQVLLHYWMNQIDKRYYLLDKPEIEVGVYNDSSRNLSSSLAVSSICRGLHRVGRGKSCPAQK
jgi:hypothetical protein